MKKRNTDLSPGSATVTLFGKEYEIVFSLAAIDEVCERLDCKVSEIAEILKDSESKDFRKKIVAILAALVNEAVAVHNEDFPDDEWKEVTERSIMRRMTNVEFANIFESVVNAYVNGFISKAGIRDEDDISADPNPTRATA